MCPLHPISCHLSRTFRSTSPLLIKLWTIQNLSYSAYNNQRMNNNQRVNKGKQMSTTAVGRLKTNYIRINKIKRSLKVSSQEKKTYKNEHDFPISIHHQPSEENYNNRYRVRTQEAPSQHKSNKKFTFFTHKLDLPLPQQFYILRLCQNLQTAKYKIRERPSSLDPPIYRAEKVVRSSKRKDKYNSLPKRIKLNNASPDPLGSSRREELKWRMQVLSCEVSQLLDNDSRL